MTNEEREQALLDRVDKIGLPIGEGGEGYVAWEEECYGCGDVGHWGFVSLFFPQSFSLKLTLAFTGLSHETSRNYATGTRRLLPRKCAQRAVR